MAQQLDGNDNLLVNSSKIKSVLELNGAEWALGASLGELAEAYEPKSTLELSSLRLWDFDLDTTVSAIVIQVLKRHSKTLHDVLFHECSGHMDLVLTVALTSLAALQSLHIATGRLSTSAFDPCANALGVGLQMNHTLKRLSLQAGSNVFFTLSADAARTLANGLAKNCMLEELRISSCRFGERGAIHLLANGIKSHRFLKRVQVKSCFVFNGYALDDDALVDLIRALEHNCNLQELDLSGNKCLRSSLSALSKLLEKTTLRHLNLSCQCIGRGTNNGNNSDDEEVPGAGEFMDLSLLVAALGRTCTLESIELRYNKLTDTDMAYLASALAHNTSITYVGLSNNLIGDTGLSILASRVGSMKRLERMVLSNNPYTSEGVLELAYGLKDNFSLKSLELDSHPQDPRGFRLARYYVDLNWAGRQFLNSRYYQQELPESLWSLIFTRTNLVANKEAGRERQIDMLYCLIRNGPALFPT